MRPVLIQVPYELGRKGVGLAKGVPVLAGALAEEAAEATRATRGANFRNEIAASMDVIRAVARRVREVTARGDLPVVLAGNCNSSLGTVAGLGNGGRLGVVWLDAHADFNTPETTEGGFFDGMALAMLTGTGWARLRASVEGLEPVAEQSVVLIGACDLDEGERVRLERSEIVVAEPPFESALDCLAERVREAYLHVDLDVLDPSTARANSFAVEGGLTRAQVEQVVEAVVQRFTVRAVAFTAYEPDCDSDGAVPAIARALFTRVVGAREGLAA